jgi:hypothetical protein
MGELMRHRQTKGAATDMLDLTPPAPHSDSTVCHERAVASIGGAQLYER